MRASGLTYVTSDLYPEELLKADAAFEKMVLDLSSKNIDPALFNRFDCVMSRMVGEHIQDGEQFHKNIYDLLQPGGISVHFLAALGSLPFVVNRFMPDWLSDLLLKTFSPRQDLNQHGKFKAYYSWSRGPQRVMLERFMKLGFEVELYQGYFGHSYYKRKLPWLHRLEVFKSKWLVRHPIPSLCCYSTIVLRKPLVASSDRPQ